MPATGKASGGAEKLDAQTVTAGVTYAKRCNYGALAGLVGEADDDGNTLADKSSNVPAPPPTKSVKAPPVNKAPASTGGERPQDRPKVVPINNPVPKAAIPQEPVQPPTPQPATTVTHDLPFDAVVPDQTAKFSLKADISAAAETPVSSEKPVESTGSQSEQADILPDTSEKPSKSQFDTYVAKVRDEIKPALEKAGFKPSKGMQTGAKLKNFILSAFGNSGSKELTDLTIRQWDAFIEAYGTTDAATFALKVEEANKK
jgi:hypothetical protein